MVSRAPPVAVGMRITDSNDLASTSISCGRKEFSAATANGYDPVKSSRVCRNCCPRVAVGNGERIEYVIPRFGRDDASTTKLVLVTDNVVIVDYGLGNLASVLNMVRKVGGSATVTRDL